MKSVPGAVATGSNALHALVSPENNPVATAPGTDLIDQLQPGSDGRFYVPKEIRALGIRFLR